MLHIHPLVGIVRISLRLFKPIRESEDRTVTEVGSDERCTRSNRFPLCLF